MGLFSFFKNQVIEMIEWTETCSETIVHPILFTNQSIKMGANLKVRETQVAVIVNDGKVADIFGPGKYILTQDNMPILSAQKLWKFGYKAPFRAEVYYVNTKQFTDMKWTTVNPLMMKPHDYGEIRLKANGTYSLRVINAEKFMKEIFGKNQIYDTSYILGQLKSIVIAGLSDLLNETNIPPTELASHYDDLSEDVENKLRERFAEDGLELCCFIIDNIILPEEVVSADREVAAVSAEEAEIAEIDVVEVEAPVEPVQIKCDECGHLVTADMKFCSNCGVGVKLERPCSCGYYMLSGVMKFCPNCGVKV
jgi:membrane protease subunit (stomatin/prohibitin family)